MHAEEESTVDLTISRTCTPHSYQPNKLFQSAVTEMGEFDGVAALQAVS